VGPVEFSTSCAIELNDIESNSALESTDNTSTHSEINANDANILNERANIIKFLTNNTSRSVYTKPYENDATNTRPVYIKLNINDVISAIQNYIENKSLKHGLSFHIDETLSELFDMEVDKNILLSVLENKIIQYFGIIFSSTDVNVNNNSADDVIINVEETKDNIIDNFDDDFNETTNPIITENIIVDNEALSKRAKLLNFLSNKTSSQPCIFVLENKESIYIKLTSFIILSEITTYLVDNNLAKGSVYVADETLIELLNIKPTQSNDLKYLRDIVRLHFRNKIGETSIGDADPGCCSLIAAILILIIFVVIIVSSKHKHDSDDS